MQTGLVSEVISVIPLELLLLLPLGLRTSSTSSFLTQESLLLLTV